MKIIDVRLLQVKGVMPGEGDFWEERLARPTDVYAQFRTVNNHDGGVQLEDGFAITTVFLEIVSDEGVDGLAGPVPHAVASIIHGQLRPLLLGQDQRGGLCLVGFACQMDAATGVSPAGRFVTGRNSGVRIDAGLCGAGYGAGARAGAGV